MMQTKIGTRGEIVIPKQIRDYLELTAGTPVRLEVQDGTVKISPQQKNTVEKMRARAKQYNYNSQDLIVGDELYEQVL